MAKATETPDNEAIAPIWKVPIGPAPSANIHEPIALPLNLLGTTSCIIPWDNKSDSAITAFITASTTNTKIKLLAKESAISEQPKINIVIK